MTMMSYDNVTFSSCDAFLTHDVVYCASTTSDVSWKKGTTEHQMRLLVVKTCADCRHATVLTSVMETGTKIFFVVEILMLVC